MVSVLDQGIQCGVIKLAQHSNWFKYKDYVLFAFGLNRPGKYNLKAKISMLRTRFAHMAENEQDVIYLLECISEYLMVANSLLTEHGFPISVINSLNLAYLNAYAEIGPDRAIDETTYAVKVMQDYTDEFLHAITLSPRFLSWEGSADVKPLIGHFLAVITATHNGKLSDAVQIAYLLRQLSELLGRVKSCSRVQTLANDAIAAYVDQETEMRSWTYNSEILSNLRGIISEWYPEDMWKSAMQNLCPVLSGGAPYGATKREGADHYYKFNHFVENEMLHSWRETYGVPSGVPDFDFWNTYEYDNELLELGLPQGVPSHPLTLKTIGNESFECELVFVPKTARKLRSISKESPYLQYMQHGVQHAMVDIGRKTSLRNHVDYSRADLSAEMAAEGGRSGRYATLDLSAASDSVTSELVLGIFPQYVRDALFATRSEFVRLPNGERLRLVKFAPMGSATCFPVETVTFASICELAKRRLGLVDANYRVYGDDIVVDERLCDEVRELLGALHFKVNTLKSYYGRNQYNFREACGGESVNGFDIKPYRVSRSRYSIWSMTPELIRSSYIDTISELWWPFRDTAKLLIKRLELYVWDFQYFDSIVGHYARYACLADRLPWTRIKAHPVYNPDPVVSVSAFADYNNIYTRKDGRWVEKELVKTPKRYYRMDRIHHCRGNLLNPTIDLENGSCSGTTALADWLSRAERRQAEPDFTEYPTTQAAWQAYTKALGRMLGTPLEWGDCAASEQLLVPWTTKSPRARRYMRTGH